jgi:hypothetical protein
VTADSTAGAPTAASCESRASPARTPRGAARCEECSDAVSSVENGGVEEEQRRPWSSHGGHGCSSHAVAKVDDAESMSERGAEGSSASASGGA